MRFLDIDTLFTTRQGGALPRPRLSPYAGIKQVDGRHVLAGSGASGASLPPLLMEQLQLLCGQAERDMIAATPNDLLVASDHLLQALALLPPPPHPWDAAGWILSHLGEVGWRLTHSTALSHDERFSVLSTALRAFSDGLWSPGLAGNPWVHLRLGQLQLEVGDTDTGQHELRRALELAGPTIFALEDPRYTPA